MQIRSSNIANSQKARPPRSKERQKDVKKPYKETIVTDSIIGASLGTMVGEKAGKVGFIGATTFLGYTVGMMTGHGDIGTYVGTGVGLGAGLLLENKFSIGKTVGGAAGFVSGGILGGVTGVVVGGASALLNADFF